MHVISIVSSKGGVGKTTLTSALAVTAAKDGARVALADLDPQGSLESWLNRRAGDELEFMEAEKASEAVEGIDEEKYDYLFVDTPPAFVRLIEDAMDVSDLVLIPLRASALDILASEDAVLMARGWREGKAGQAKEVAHLCIINDAEPKWKTTDAARKYLDAAKVPVAKAIITHRAAYLGAMTSGKIGPEIDRTGTTKEEIGALWAEIKALVGKNKRSKARV